MNETEVGGRKYRIGKLDAMTQLLIVKRLARTIDAWGDVARAMKDGRDVIDVMGSLGAAIADVPDADVAWIVDRCMSIVQRQADGGVAWTPIWNAQAHMTQFPDEIGLAEVMKLTYEVIRVNVSSFFSGPLFTSLVQTASGQGSTS